jgi:hypothetical protein
LSARQSFSLSLLYLYLLFSSLPSFSCPYCAQPAHAGGNRNERSGHAGATLTCEALQPEEIRFLPLRAIGRDEKRERNARELLECYMVRVCMLLPFDRSINRFGSGIQSKASVGKQL